MPQQRVPDKETAVQAVKILSGDVQDIEDALNDWLLTMEEKHIFEMGTAVHGGASDLVVIINYRVALKYNLIEYDMGPEGPTNSRKVGEETPGGLTVPEVKLTLT